MFELEGEGLVKPRNTSTAEGFLPLHPQVQLHMQVESLPAVLFLDV